MPAPAQKRRLRIVAVLAAAAMLLSLVAGGISALTDDPPPDRPEDTTPEGGERPDPDVVLYGDSLSVEAVDYIQGFLTAEASDLEVEVTPIAGASICDFEDAFQLDLDRAAPELVVLQFAGNNASPCLTADGGDGDGDTGGGDDAGEGDDTDSGDGGAGGPLPEDARPTGQELAETYAEDADEVTELMVEQDVQVLWVGPPPAPGLPGDATGLIDQRYRDLVADWEDRAPGQVHYTPAGDAVTGPDGGYVTTLPCLEDEAEEAEAAGCEDGEIQVRHDDRVHFCPDELAARGCPVYASGARRYGEAIAEAVGDLVGDRGRSGREQAAP